MIRLSVALAMIGVLWTLASANAEPKIAWATLSVNAVMWTACRNRGECRAPH